MDRPNSHKHEAHKIHQYARHNLTVVSCTANDYQQCMQNPEFETIANFKVITYVNCIVNNILIPWIVNCSECTIYASMSLVFIICSDFGYISYRKRESKCL
jgi:hypothetical protein